MGLPRTTALALRGALAKAQSTNAAPSSACPYLLYNVPSTLLTPNVQPRTWDDVLKDPVFGTFFFRGATVIDQERAETSTSGSSLNSEASSPPLPNIANLQSELLPKSQASCSTPYWPKGSLGRRRSNTTPTVKLRSSLKNCSIGDIFSLPGMAMRARIDQIMQEAASWAETEAEESEGEIEDEGEEERVSHQVWMSVLPAQAIIGKSGVVFGYWSKAPYG